MRRSTTLFAALAPLLLLTGLVLGTPARVEAAGSGSTTCAVAYNAFDNDQDNDGNTNPGGNSSDLAYPGYTNGLTVYIDIKQGSTGCASSVFNKSAWYVMLSRWSTGVLGGTNVSEVDSVPKSIMETASVYDYVNDFGSGFSLSAGGEIVPASGTSVTITGDVTECDIAQSTTAGFASGNYVRHSSSSGSGAFYWLALSSGNAGSSYRRSFAGGWTVAGGAKGYCFNLVDPRRTDTIIYDVTAPTIDVPRFNGGVVATNATTVNITSNNPQDSGGLWLAAYSNSAGCTAVDPSPWGPWELIPTGATEITKTGWSITSGYGATASEGTKTVCIRVMDRAGNITMKKSTIIYDLTAPTVTGFTTSVGSPTNATSIAYTLTFSESVTDFTASDISTTGTATGCVDTVSGSGTSYTVTFTGCSTTGTLIPRLAANAVTDRAGNVGPASAATGPTRTLDRIPPVVSSFVRDTATDTGDSTADGITNASSVAFLLEFSESVTGLIGADFTASGTAVGCTVGAPTGSGSSYRVAVSGCGEGTLTLTLRASTVIDAATNTGPAAAANAAATFTIDRTAPVGCSAVLDAGSAWTQSATIPLALSCTTVAPTDRMRFSNNGTSYSADEPYAATKSWSLVTGAGGSAAEGLRTVYAQVFDLAGNTSSSSDTIGYDATAPSVSFSSPAAAGYSNASGYTVTYSASDAASGLPAGGKIIRRYAATATSATCPAGGYVLDATVAGFPSGTLSTGLTHAECYYWTLTATDVAGNTTTATSPAILVDRIGPEISSVIIGDGSGATISTSIAATATATDALSGLAKIRWSAESGREWSDSCLQSPSSLPYNTGRNKPDISLGAGAGAYGVMVQVCDQAGNVRSYANVVTLTSAKTPPQLTLGARVVDCAAPTDLLATNSSGVVYWPVGRELCLLPLPTLTRAGSDSTSGELLTGRLDTSGTLTSTLLSSNPCPVNSACAGVVGRYPTAAIGVVRSYNPTTGVGEPLQIRLDRETTTAVNSVSAVSLVVRLSVVVRWYNAAGALVRTDAAYPVTLELRIKSLASGVRPY